MKKNGFDLVEILIVVIILGILATIVIPQFVKTLPPAEGPLGIRVTASPGNSTWNQPGGVFFKIRYGYGRKEDIDFRDYGFDGTLDYVSYYDQEDKKKHEVDPNMPEWNLWVEHYLQVRQKATIGKKPELAQ
ncbi:hypothetical protein AMJ47_03305 [Parcubacteria bacterium DG_72]|nr:MAG: hypothetical protein AMJ47_03305 [Parcubacteria bacterium DG_72]